MWFDTREFVLECNGEPIGGRKNMLYQYKNVGRVWFTDLETYKGEYVIEVRCSLFNASDINLDYPSEPPEPPSPP